MLECKIYIANQLVDGTRAEREGNASVAIASYLNFLALFPLWRKFPLSVLYSNCTVLVQSCTRSGIRFDAQLAFRSRSRSRSVYSGGTQPGILVSFVTLWPKNCDTLPLFLRDTLDAKMLRKWHPGKTNAKYTCQAISPVYCMCIVCNRIIIVNVHY